MNFYKLSEEFLLNMADEIEKRDNDCFFDVEYFDGILNITIHNTKKQYVINRHNANQKIWFSSPFSGADYFVYNQEKDIWINDKNISLKEILFNELKI